MNRIKECFIYWLNACFHEPVNAYVEKMAGFSVSSTVDEITQQKWIENGDWDSLRNYKGRLYKSVSYALICEAPEDIVLNYLRYASPIDDEKQIALIKRDICNQTHLSREYFAVFRACVPAQQLIRDYDAQLWRKVVVLNYGWEHEFEHKFGSISKWQEKLIANIEKLDTCNFDEILSILRTIE